MTLQLIDIHYDEEEQRPLFNANDVRTSDVYMIHFVTFNRASGYRIDNQDQNL